MKAESLEYELRFARPPAPDANARARAKQAAIAEFERIHSRRARQPAAFVGWRLRGPWLVGFATACVVVIGVSIFWLMPPEQREIDLVVPLDARTTIETPIAPVEIEARAVDEPASIEPASAPAADRQASAPTTDQPAPAPATPSTQGPVQPGPSGEPADAQEVVVQARKRQTVIHESPVPIVRVGPEMNRLEEVTVSGSSIESHRARRSAAEREQRVASASAIVPPVFAPRAEGGDRFESFTINPVKRTAEDPISTFSVDVDTASYSYVRRQLNEGRLPPVDAVRVEEMINYFDYAWPAPDSASVPFEPTIAVSDSPWGEGRKLVHIGIRGYDIPSRRQPDVNLVLLLDVSGSMNSPDKLPLAVRSMELLLDSLKPTDTVAIVVYASAEGVVLEPTPVRNRETIERALSSLRPGGSTAGAAGIRLAYEMAHRHFRRDGVNRILLATDGDFNVGITNLNELKGYVQREREKGVFLSVLGFGQGNYRDEMAQMLAQNGNGVAAYIDSLNEARKVLVQQATGSLFTIAKDVKLQVEFNPATVAEYRLVGYETRALNREDFDNDRIDAGDVGAGHTVTAIYEITPVGSGATLIDERRYGTPERSTARRGKENEYGYLRIRYKLPEERRSRLLRKPIRVDTRVPAALEKDVQFSTAVAGFGQLLKGGHYTGSLGYEDVIRQAEAAIGDDPNGYRAEFVQLVRKAQAAADR